MRRRNALRLLTLSLISFRCFRHVVVTNSVKEVGELVKVPNPGMGCSPFQPLVSPGALLGIRLPNGCFQISQRFCRSTSGLLALHVHARGLLLRQRGES